MARGAARKMEVAPCTVNCPANICAFGYLGLARAGLYDEALDLIREAVPLPVALGRVCHHPCESACIRGEYDEAVSINGVKRFLAEGESEAHRKAWLDSLGAGIEEHGRKVAVVGAGPAGLTAAYELRLRGYSVTLLEKEDRPGGMLALGIPAYRMPRDLLQSEIDALLSLGIELKAGWALGKDGKLGDLLDQGFEAICVAAGDWQGRGMGLEGEDAEGIVDALRFLKQINLGQRREVGERVLVIGGGDAAIDAARSAVRLGAKSVEILYRRSAAEMPAAAEEVQAALEEGVHIRYQTVPSRWMVEGAKLKAAACLRTELGEADKSGRRRPVPVAGSEFEQACDMAILAVGQVVEDSLLDGDLELKRRERGEVVADDQTGATSHPQIFVAGDLATGPQTVIVAIASGRKAAFGLDLSLRGEGVPSVQLRSPADLEGQAAYRPPDVPEQARQLGQARPAAERVRDFDAEGFGLGEEQILAEADRCLSCQLCGRCDNCIDNFGCPAIYKQDGKVFIDEVLCIGCGLCAQLCPNHAIHPVGMEVF
mgnify:CR=1 FL=1